MTERKPTLCVVAGPNGSGKTTTTTQLLRMTDGHPYKQYTDDIPEWALTILK